MIMGARASQLKNQINKVTADIEQLRMRGAKSALTSGQISKRAYEAQAGIGVDGILAGAILGWTFAFYGAGVGHVIESRANELKHLIEQAQELYADANDTGMQRKIDDAVRAEGERLKSLQAAMAEEAKAGSKPAGEA